MSGKVPLRLTALLLASSFCWVASSASAQQTLPPQTTDRTLEQHQQMAHSIREQAGD